MNANDGEVICTACREPLNRDDKNCWRCGSHSLKSMLAWTASIPSPVSSPVMPNIGPPPPMNVPHGTPLAKAEVEMDRLWDLFRCQPGLSGKRGTFSGNPYKGAWVRAMQRFLNGESA